jgi:glucose/arabinose dehydrogenase
MSKPTLAFLAAGLAALYSAACADDDAETSTDAEAARDGEVLDGAVVDGPLTDGASPDGPVVDAGRPDALPPVPDAAAGACLPSSVSLTRQALAEGFDFGTVTDIKSPPGDPRIFVVGKDGEISIIGADGTVAEEPFLELDVDTSTERGLLGIAFHPDYAENRRFFVFYTPYLTSNVTIAEGRASAAEPDRAEAELITLIDEPHDAGNHNGGWLDFGPDGKLYASLGDNGKGSATAQDPNSPFGKIFRLDVGTPGVCTAPADNPFAGGGGRAEVWAYGLRNPWRASFDRLTGDLYIADVGDGGWEEVNVQPAGSAGGQNYGWAIMEGNHCSGCDMTGLTLPVHEYPHDGNTAIIGGYVYRGQALPECAGTYFFADYRTNAVGSLRWNGAGGVNDVTTNWPTLAGPSITSFGLDAAGELLVAVDGTIHRIGRDL